VPTACTERRAAGVSSSRVACGRRADECWQSSRAQSAAAPGRRSGWRCVRRGARRPLGPVPAAVRQAEVALRLSEPRFLRRRGAYEPPRLCSSVPLDNTDVLLHSRASALTPDALNCGQDVPDSPSKAPRTTRHNRVSSPFAARCGRRSSVSSAPLLQRWTRILRIGIRLASRASSSLHTARSIEAAEASRLRVVCALTSGKRGRERDCVLRVRRAVEQAVA
jgi:hypothetical protein